MLKGNVLRRGLFFKFYSGIFKVFPKRKRYGGKFHSTFFFFFFRKWFTKRKKNSKEVSPCPPSFLKGLFFINFNFFTNNVHKKYLLFIGILGTYKTLLGGGGILHWQDIAFFFSKKL